MRTKTVRRYYAALVMLAIILSVSVAGALGIATIWNKTNKDVVTIMNLTTQARASELDLVLLKIKDAVDTVSSYVGARIASTNMEEALEIQKAGLDEEIRELFQSEVAHLEGVVGYYVIYSDTYDTRVNGFAYRKDSMTAVSYYEITGEGLAGLERSAEDDWYRIAEAKKSPVWIPIRECEYTDGYIFSYAVPFYQGDELIGVACVDVDFEMLAKPVREISLFGGGYAYLTDDKGKVYYHPLIGYGVLLTEDEDDVPEVDNALGGTSNHGKLISYEYKGQKKKMAFQALINEMRLIITANEDDVLRETNSLIRKIILTAVVIMILFIILALMFEKRAMHPVLDKMDSMAHLDGLTGVQNRASFLEILEALNKRIQDQKAVFGFVMFDANNLKMINDRYGHEMGDIYLKGVVELITACYPGYPIFRIGGDEFVVLAQGKDSLEEAVRCLDQIDTRQKQRLRENHEVWEKPSVAAAFAAYDPQNHQTAEEVLAQADQLMYQKKQQMKQDLDLGFSPRSGRS